MSLANWLADLLGIKIVKDGANTAYPQRDTIRFPGAVVADNSVLGCTDVTITAAAAIPSVANQAAISLLVSASFTEGALVRASNCDDYFELLNSPGALTPDGITVVLADNGTSVWVRKGFVSQRNASTAAWHIDQQFGNDANAGTSAGAGNALGSVEELCRRVCPHGVRAKLTQNVTVTFHDTSARTYGDTAVASSTPFNFTFIGSETLGADITVTVTATNAATPTRGALVATAGPTLIGSGQKKLQVTSGAHIGAIGCVDGAAVDATHVFVKEWVDATGAVVAITTGDKVALVTQLTSVGSLSVLSSALGGQVIFKNLVCLKGGESIAFQPGTSFNGSSPPMLDGCELGPSGGGGGTWLGTWHWRNCRHTNGNGAHSQGVLYSTGNAFQAPLALTQKSHMLVRAGNLSDGNTASISITGGASVRVAANWQFSNISGAASYFRASDAQVHYDSMLPTAGNFDMQPFTQLEIGVASAGRMWGVGNTATALAALNGIALQGADMPQIVGWSAFTAHNPNQQKTIVAVPARNSSLGSTIVLTAPPKGAYLVRCQFPITVAGTGGSTLTVSVAATCAAGVVTQTNPTPYNIGALGVLSAMFLVDCDGISNITVLTTLSGAAGALSYQGSVAADRYGVAA